MRSWSLGAESRCGAPLLVWSSSNRKGDRWPRLLGLIPIILTIVGHTYYQLPVPNDTDSLIIYLFTTYNVLLEMVFRTRYPRPRSLDHPSFLIPPGSVFLQVSRFRFRLGDLDAVIKAVSCLPVAIISYTVFHGVVVNAQV